MIINGPPKKIGFKDLPTKWRISDLYSALVKSKQIISDSRDLFVYDNQAEFWYRSMESEDMTIIMSLLSSELSNCLSKSELTSIADKLKKDPQIIKNLDKKAEQNQFLLNTTNCVVDVRNGAILNRQPSMGFDYILGFNYLKDAKIEDAKNFVKWADSSLGYHSNNMKTNRLLQMIGYSICSVPGRKAVFLIGEPACGKSVICNIIQEVVGERYVTNIPLGKLGNRFSLGELNGIRVNIHREVSSSDFSKIDVSRVL